MRNSWPIRSLLAVAIAASGPAWAADSGAGSPSAEGTGQSTPKMQGDENATNPNGQPATPESEGAGQDNGTANSGPSPRDQPNPGLKIDPRMNRLPSKRGGNDNGTAEQGAQGNDNGASGQNGPATQTPPGDVKPQNPAEPATPIFPANPPPPADPGQPGNPVTPTAIRIA